MTLLRLLICITVSLAAALTLRPDEPAQIVVYAQRDTEARSWLPVSCDDQVAAELKQGRYFVINVPPGRDTLVIEKGVPLILEVRAGGKYFVRLDWNYTVGQRPIPIFSKVADAAGRAEIKYLSYVGAKRVHSPSVAKTEPVETAQPQLRTRYEE